MLYSCKTCLKIFKKEFDKCPICGGEIKITLNKVYTKETEINYICPHCNHNFPIYFDICPKCGKRSNKCSHCGYFLRDKVDICPSCGKKTK